MRYVLSSPYHQKPCSDKPEMIPGPALAPPYLSDPDQLGKGRSRLRREKLVRLEIPSWIHEGEFVLSRGSLPGRPAVPATVSTRG